MLHVLTPKRFAYAGLPVGSGTWPGEAILPSEDVQAHGACDGSGAGRAAESCVDVGDVAVHRVLAQHQPFGDLMVS
jgi:hypothetical protein